MAMNTSSVTRETGIVIRLAVEHLPVLTMRKDSLRSGCELITGVFSDNLEPTPAGNKSVRVHVFRPKEKQAHRAEAWRPGRQGARHKPRHKIYVTRGRPGR